MAVPAAILCDVPMHSAIPRVIHQTYRSKKDIPAEIRANIEHLKRQNPSFVHVLYDDNDIESFILEEYGLEMLAAYKRISPEYGAARADLFRYLLIYRWGGVYLDIKSTTTRPLDETITPIDRYLLSHWDNKVGDEHEGWGHDADYLGLPRGEFQQWNIIAVPGHPFLAAVIRRVLKNIENYSPWKDGVGRLATLSTMGPVCYTRTIQALLDEHPHRVADTHAALGLRYSCLADRLAHRQLSPTYYRKNTTPLIRANTTFGKISDAIFVAKSNSRILKIVNKVRARL